MADTKNARGKEVNVEDLLRLKRAERPDEAFWNTFDRELHQRMLQTLVKKDPWYVQLLRGLSGRIAQTATVGAAAAFLAMMVVRPALVDSTQIERSPTFAKEEAKTAFSAPVEVAMSDLDTALTPDYKIQAISTSSANSDLGYTQEYAHDTFQVAAYDSAAYVADADSFAGTGLATTLVY